MLFAGFGNTLKKPEALAGKLTDVWRQEQPRSEASQQAKGEAEGDVIFELSDSVCLAEEVHVAKGSEAPLLLRVLKPGDGLTFEMSRGIAEMAGMRRFEECDERVVLGGQAELPATPDDPGAELYMSAGNASYEAHVEGALHQLDISGKRKAACEGSGDEGGFGDSEHGVGPSCSKAVS